MWWDLNVNGYNLSSKISINASTEIVEFSALRPQKSYGCLLLYFSPRPSGPCQPPQITFHWQMLSLQTSFEQNSSMRGGEYRELRWKGMHNRLREIWRGQINGTPLHDLSITGIASYGMVQALINWLVYQQLYISIWSERCLLQIEYFPHVLHVTQVYCS